MFKAGDYIVYGSNGVCRIDKVGKLNSSCVQKDRIYYTLSPYYSKGSTIFTPVDNQKVVMRSVIGKEEAIKLVDEMKDIDSLGIADEKGREQKYKEMIRKCDCRELVKIIKTIHLRQELRTAEGKKVTAEDTKYFQIAEERLYGELAISLEMDKEGVKEYINSKVG